MQISLDFNKKMQSGEPEFVECRKPRRKIVPLGEEQVMKYDESCRMQRYVDLKGTEYIRYRSGDKENWVVVR